MLLGNRSRLRYERLYLLKHLSMKEELQSEFYLHRYAFLQFYNHSIPYRQAAGHRSGAYRKYAWMLHERSRRLLVVVDLAFHLALNAHEIQLFLLSAHDLVGFQIEALAY